MARPNNHLAVSNKFQRSVAEATVRLRALALIVLGLSAAIAPTPASAVETLSAASLKILREIPRAGDFLAVGFDSLWMMSGNRLVRIHINQAQPAIEEIEVPGYLGLTRGIAIGAGAVWIPDTGSQTIYKIDPQTDHVIGQFKVKGRFSGSEGSVGVSDSAVWIARASANAPTGPNKTLARLNTATGNEEDDIELPSEIAGVIVASGSVWATGADSGLLYRINPERKSFIAINLHGRPRFLTSTEDSIWVIDQSDGSVRRISVATGDVLATIATDFQGQGGDITVGNGYVWITAPGKPLGQIDLRTNTFVREFVGPGFGDAIRFGEHSLWISGSVIRQIRPPE